MPVKEVIVLATVLFTASTVTKTWLLSGSIHWKSAITVAIASLPFAYFGGLLVADAPAELLRKLLGMMVLLYLLVTRFNVLPKFEVGNTGLILGSAGYGFVSGLLGSGNLIKVILFREMSLTREGFVGVMAATSIFANLAKMAAYFQSSMYTRELLSPSIGLVIAAVSAAIIGRLLLRKISAPKFNSGLEIILAISAITLLL